MAPANSLRQGGYVLWQSTTTPKIILIATGSEVHIALEAGQKLQERGILARIVSLPSWELFDAQPEAYRKNIIMANHNCSNFYRGWCPTGVGKVCRLGGIVIGIPRFGISAPGNIVYEKFGLTVPRLVEEA